MDEVRIEQILHYWFGDLDGPFDVDKSRSKLWWAGDDAIDAEVRERFGDDVRRAIDGERDAWADSPRGALALVILLDQLTRNIGRGAAEAFAGDRAALAVSLAAQERGLGRALRLVERAFLYMPMMHAEDPEIARRSQEVFAELSAEVKAAGSQELPDFRSHADQHAGIVLRFGRYPHRNEILGRTSTPEEVAFLAGGGPTFGQKKAPSGP